MFLINPCLALAGLKLNAAAHRGLPLGGDVLLMSPLASVGSLKLFPTGSKKKKNLIALL